MCGICGIIDYSKNRAGKERLHEMCSRISHRGPDDEGYFFRSTAPNIGLGHRRLSIIDLSKSGRQPMSNEDGNIWIVMNGEIYNYPDLKKELTDKGHIFKSSTDTETIIHLYEEYGRECVSRLRGMFAFAIWDDRNRSLFMARDRVGKKPLLYSFSNHAFVFSSEFASILASGLVDKEINRQAIDYYLTFGYVPAPLTIYKNVFKLMPAETLILNDKELLTEKYWDLDYSKKLLISEEEAASEVLRLLRDAVKIRLSSDVPLGAFLSGGIDSSTVVALMSQLSSKKVKTFSIGFKEDDYSELRFARNISKKFGTEHNEFIVKPEALKILPLLVERYGEPYADSSCIPTYYVAKESKRFVTVALNGDGGDEVFAGYQRYQGVLLAEKFPAASKGLIKHIQAALPDSPDPKNILRKCKRFLQGAVMPINRRYLRWVSIFDDEKKSGVYSEEFLDTLKVSQGTSPLDRFLLDSRGGAVLDGLLKADTFTYLPNDLLVKVDIAAMSNSLEGRSPFLDHKLMEFAARLPVNYKIKGFERKYILKRAISGIVPKENIYRSKMGFGVPVGEWFRNDLKDFLREVLLSKNHLKRGYFKPGSIEGMIKTHVQKKADYSNQLWSLVMLELWHQRFID